MNRVIIILISFDNIKGCPYNQSNFCKSSTWFVTFFYMRDFLINRQVNRGNLTGHPVHYLNSERSNSGLPVSLRHRREMNTAITYCPQNPLGSLEIGVETFTR